jgi:hypothetical protein
MATPAEKIIAGRREKCRKITPSAIYQGELAVGTQTVTIAAGQTTAANITDTLYTPSAANTIFRIGTWDGTPLGFLDSNLITDMHPTDVRMSPWAADSTGATNFIVGTDPDSDFPMAEWHTETTAAHRRRPHRRCGSVSRGFDQGRPTINVNRGAYDSPAQALTAQPNSRGLTVGNWRGNNCTYLFNIPTTALKTGTNTIDIYCTSGANVTWSASSGTIDGTGLYTAGDAPATPTITATSGSVSGQTILTIGNTAPTVATAASGSPSPVTGTTTNLSVLGADDGGESNLIYTWTADPSDPAPASITFAPGVSNGTNAANNATATFTAAGTYKFHATITDAGGLTTSSPVSLTVSQTLTGITLSPSSATPTVGGTTQFSAVGLDQFDNELTIQPTFAWTLFSGVGSQLPKQNWPEGIYHSLSVWTIMQGNRMFRR